MVKPELVQEFAKTAIAYGQALYHYQESQELIKRQKSYNQSLLQWTRSKETRQASNEARKILRKDISEQRERLKTDAAVSKKLGKRVARLERALEIKTRQLVAAK